MRMKEKNKAACLLPDLLLIEVDISTIEESLFFCEVDVRLLYNTYWPDLFPCRLKVPLVQEWVVDIAVNSSSYRIVAFYD